MKIINASVDLTKIDKSKINKHQNGALYYNITIYVNDEANKFGQDVSIATSITKEQREQGIKQTYIGNGKVVMDKPSTGDAKPQSGSIPFIEKKADEFNDLPF